MNVLVYVVENAISDQGALFCYEKMKEMELIALQEIRYDEGLLTPFGKRLLEQAITRNPTTEEEVEEMIRKKREEEEEEEEEKEVEKTEELTINDVSEKIEEVENDTHEGGELDKNSDGWKEKEDNDEIPSTRRSCCVII